jgi:hypothetical protein
VHVTVQVDETGTDDQVADVDDPRLVGHRKRWPDSGDRPTVDEYVGRGVRP